MPTPWAWLRSLLGRPALQPAPAARAHFRPALQARYDNAQWTDENQRNWRSADYLSAKSANNYQVRRQLRLRSRYELSNNPYLYGICTSNADHLVATGPTLQCLRSNAAENRAVQNAWNEWCQEVELVEKLRTCKLAKTVDGEGFLVLKTVSDLEHPVQLYPVDVEADQVTTPAPRNLQELWVDGLVLHPVTGRPIAYDVLRTHPGDFFYPNLNPLECDRIQARWVIHWFPKFRPGQVRGVPVFTPALDLFAELRAFRKAVLAKAQIAANLTAVLESEGPADDTGTLTATPFESIPIDRGVMTTLPGGAKLHQYDNGDPSTSYEMFQEKCLGEAVRPLSYPLNLALGTSQKFNFSSARLDHIEYRDALDVERAQCQRCVLCRIFAAWLGEAVLIQGYLPRSIRGPADVPHEWHWPGYAPLDPVQDAQADHERISNGTLTWQQFWASRGYDWRTVMRQQEEERQEIEKLKLVFGEPLTKTETVDESDPQGEPPDTRAEGLLPLQGGDDDQPRDARQAQRDREEEAWDAARQEEDDAREARREAEDRELEGRRDQEDARGGGTRAGREPALRAYDPQQPRGDDGRWGTGGGTGKTTRTPAPRSPVVPEPREMSPAAAKVHQALSAHIDRQSKLSPAQKADYKRAMAIVLSRMPAAAVKGAARGTRGVAFYGDGKALTGALADKYVEVAGLVARGGEARGGYDSKGTLHLDGPVARAADEDTLRTARTNTHENYAHELTHAIDGPERRLSSSPAWREAWAAELQSAGQRKPRLSGYAGGKPHEGLAEFGRLLYGTDVDRGAIEKHFPKCAAFFKKEGLWG